MKLARAYLAGPMSGLPQFNFPAFHLATVDLRNKGWDIVSPAELDDPEIRKEAMASTRGEHGDTRGTWGDFLARDVKIIADDGVEAVICLDGWQYSRGARLETFIAKLQGMPVYRYSDLLPVSYDELKEAHFFDQCEPD